MCKSLINKDILSFQEKLSTIQLMQPLIALPPRTNSKPLDVSEPIFDFESEWIAIEMRSAW